NQRNLEDEDLESYASGLNLNIKRWRSCVKEGRHKERINAEQRYAMTLGARGTPTFFINGRVLTGAQPFSAFETLINEELEKAKNSGMKKSDYYQTAVVERGRKKM
ncbi:MAG: DsbA family protein, partial [Myxococcota bacterium]